MTWVCAASTIFGYGALYSDVQVTLANGQTKDLIQKAYPLSNFIAAGFAGSVRIGFKLLESLSDNLRLSPDDLRVMAWDPVSVGLNWAPLAKAVFDGSPQHEKVLGTNILMVGAAPTENCGLGAKIYFVRFASPDFTPRIMARAIKVCSIGSGAGVSEYKTTLRPLFRLTSGIHRAEISRPGGWASSLGFLISRSLSRYPRDGISRHLHIITVWRGGIYLETNDETIYPSGDRPPIEIRMPRIATSYEEFQGLADSLGVDGTMATC